MALAGNGSPGGSFAARHSGELKGRFDLSRDWVEAVSVVFVPAHAAMERLTTRIARHLVVFMDVEQQRCGVSEA
jgi:hypothetical protein